MNSKHTPGPWRTEGCTVWNAQGQITDCTSGRDDMPYAEAIANARLIACAPELLAALAGLFDSGALSAIPLAECMKYNAPIAIARAALAKVTP